MSDTFSTGSPIAIPAGPPVAIPTGPAGVGIASIVPDGNILKVTLTNGTTSILRLPILDGSGASIDPSEVMRIVDDAIAGGDFASRSELGDVVATKAEAVHRHVLADVDTLEERLEAIDGVLATLGGDDIVTSEDVAAAIAALQISEYLRIDAAAVTYAPKAHQHTVAQITDFVAEVDKRVGALTDLSAYAKTAYVDQRVTDLKLGDYLKRAEADLSYATKADVASKWSAPTTGTTGDVLTWDGTKLSLQPLSSGSFLTKSTADQTYATKTHTHAIADVAGLQTALDGKQATFTAGTASGQVLTWDGAKYVPAVLPATKVTYAYTQAGSLTVKTGVSALYNDDSKTRTATVLRASVGTAPTGSGVTVVLKINGTQAATTTIAAGATTAVVTGSWPWPSGQAMTVDITAVGSTTPGADLTVGVVA